jgi:hypothetical protein
MIVPIISAVDGGEINCYWCMLTLWQSYLRVIGSMMTPKACLEYEPTLRRIMTMEKTALMSA